MPFAVLIDKGAHTKELDNDGRQQSYRRRVMGEVRQMMVLCVHANTGTMPSIILCHLKMPLQVADAVLQSFTAQTSRLCEFLNEVIHLLMGQLDFIFTKGDFAYENGIDYPCKEAAGDSKHIVFFVHIGVSFQFAVHLGKLLVNLRFCQLICRVNGIHLLLVCNLCRNHFFLCRVHISFPVLLICVVTTIELHGFRFSMGSIIHVRSLTHVFILCFVSAPLVCSDSFYHIRSCFSIIFKKKKCMCFPSSSSLLTRFAILGIIPIRISS